MTVEFWFEFASTYSYLSVSRAPLLFKKHDVDFVWKPFLLGPIFRQRGLETSPFVLDRIKGAYMWRDIERRAEKYGLPFARPVTFPANSLPASRIMTAALQEPWSGEFATAVFQAQFVHRQDISDKQTLEQIIADCGADPKRWIERSTHEDVKSKLRVCTELAESHGLFGAPSFRVGSELFWGDDRLEDVIALAVSRKSKIS